MCAYAQIARILLITYDRSELKFLVIAEKFYQEKRAEDAEITMSAAVGKDVTSIYLPICAKCFDDQQPRLQVRSSSPTV